MSSASQQTLQDGFSWHQHEPEKEKQVRVVWKKSLTDWRHGTPGLMGDRKGWGAEEELGELWSPGLFAGVKKFEGPKSCGPHRPHLQILPILNSPTSHTHLSPNASLVCSGSHFPACLRWQWISPSPIPTPGLWARAPRLNCLWLSHRTQRSAGIWSDDWTLHPLSTKITVKTETLAWFKPHGQGRPP